MRIPHDLVDPLYWSIDEEAFFQVSHFPSLPSASALAMNVRLVPEPLRLTVHASAIMSIGEVKALAQGPTLRETHVPAFQGILLIPSWST